ncbi:MAG: hypothetical protein GXP58_01250 [Deltaproteobacteria bacterium]|nr:hypothetical protein [Deltaproteobacteria bacterium]
MDAFSSVHRGNLRQFQTDRIGGGNQGTVRRIRVNGKTAVIKDIAGRNLIYRILLGRWMLAREYRIYRKLQGLEGIPALYKKLDRDGFLCEYIAGEPLSSFARNAPLPASFFNTLNELVEKIHVRGVVHSDLKHKKNILVTADFKPYLVDFGASLIRGPRWNLLNRWFYGQFLEIDRRAVSKIRRRFSRGDPDAEDLESLERRNIMERCSTLYQSIYRFFSPKHRWKRRRKK